MAGFACFAAALAAAERGTCGHLAVVAGFATGSYPRAAVGSPGRMRCLLGYRVVPGGSSFAISEGILRAGLFVGAGLPSGTGSKFPARSVSNLRHYSFP